MNRKQIISEFLQDSKYPPLGVEEIMLMLDIPFDDREELMDILRELTDEGVIIKTSSKKYSSPQKLGYLTGTISMARGGFGFLLCPDGDVFIPASALKGALGGDKVMISLVKGSSGNKREGKVLKILERATDTVVGTFQSNRNFGFVVPRGDRFPHDIFVSKKKTALARDGQTVVVRITKWPDPDKGIRRPEGEVCEILGFESQNGVDMLAVMRSHGLTQDFERKVAVQCENLDTTISQSDIDAREDFRELNIITIDGRDSRDFDDAINISFEDGIYTLGVHIADVTHYVTENSPLDKEAMKRGTSVYFPGSVVPMLPKVLSNGICSLNPLEDRLTLSVKCKINSDGEILEHRICEGIINSKERMTYDDVTAILEGDKVLCDKYSHIYPDLCLMKELASILREKRMSKGSIDFDFPETKIVTDDNGKPIDVYKYRNGISNNIIEEFMLCANRIVAEEYFWLDIPFVYRVHEKPSIDKVKAFNSMVSSMGYKLSTAREPHSGEFAHMIKKIKGTREELIVSKAMLRSLMKAKYSQNCLGHFGLNFKYYCHFTSPIRRYPDLAIHRIIKEHLRGGISEKRRRYYEKFVAEASLRSSERELVAMEAQREAEDIKKAEYMLERVGGEYEAVISSVTGFGFFAELENGIEGLVRLSDINDDYYIFDEKTLSLIGEHTGKRYRIGDKTNIIVQGVDKISGTIDFILK